MNWADLGVAAGRWALSSSAGAAVIAILVLAVQKVLGDRISPRWRHNLWLLVVARLMLPALPAISLPLPHWPHWRALAEVAVAPPAPRRVAENSRRSLSGEAPGSDQTSVSVAESFHPVVIELPSSAAPADLEPATVVAIPRTPASPEPAAPTPVALQH